MGGSTKNEVLCREKSLLLDVCVSEKQNKFLEGEAKEKGKKYKREMCKRVEKHHV